MYSKSLHIYILAWKYMKYPKRMVLNFNKVAVRSTEGYLLSNSQTLALREVSTTHNNITLSIKFTYEARILNENISGCRFKH